MKSGYKIAIIIISITALAIVGYVLVRRRKSDYEEKTKEANGTVQQTGISPQKPRKAALLADPKLIQNLKQITPKN